MEVNIYTSLKSISFTTTLLSKIAVDFFLIEASEKLMTFELSKTAYSTTSGSIYSTFCFITKHNIKNIINKNNLNIIANLVLFETFTPLHYPHCLTGSQRL